MKLYYVTLNPHSGLQTEIEQATRDRISYTNFIAEISPSHVNEGFLDWLNREVPNEEAQ